MEYKLYLFSTSAASMAQLPLYIVDLLKELQTLPSAIMQAG